MAQNWNDWLTSLYKQNYKKLYHVAYRLTGSTDTAKDMIQDAFLLALFHKEELSVHPKPEAWIMQTLVNLIKNENRRLSSLDVPLETLYNVPAPDAEKGLEELLPSKLPEEDKKVLIWRFAQQMSYKEIANRLGISGTGCRSRVFRAVEKCRKLMNE